MIALSTAFKTAEIAISKDGKTCTRELDANCKHSENVLRVIDEMLDEMGLSIKEEEEFAVVVGPGSFTGLRIAISIVKGICAGLGRGKVTPISSLDLMAYSHIRGNKVSKDFVAVIDALSGLRFVCKYDKDGKPLSQPALVSMAEVDAMPEEKICVEEHLPYLLVPLTSKDLLDFALENRGNFCDYHTLSPVYLRKSQAEVGLEEKMLKKDKNC